MYYLKMRRTTLGPLHQIDLNRSLDDSRISFGPPGASRKSFGAPGGSSKLLSAPGSIKKPGLPSRTAGVPAASYGPEARSVMQPILVHFWVHNSFIVNV